MRSLWPYAALALLTARWWLALVRAFLADLEAAAAPAEPLPEPLPRRPRAPAPVDAHGPPLNRVLAFRGVQRRLAARRRWEAGFGRKGF